MSENGLICDSCHAKAEETDTECWNCGHTTFVYEPGNAKNQTPHSNNTPQHDNDNCRIPYCKDCLATIKAVAAVGRTQLPKSPASTGQDNEQPDCYCVCHSPTSSRPACEHCKGQYLKTEQLREAIRKLMESFARDAVDASKTARGFAYGNQVDRMVALFTTAQHQLVTELERELPEQRHKIAGEFKDRRASGFNECRNLVADLLEHKKQELEGKQ